MAPQQAIESRKLAVAQRALEYVHDGMVLGLGSGTTAEVMLAELADRVRRGLQIIGVPTSARVADLAHEKGIPLATLEEQPRIALTIDGADEIELDSFSLIKGRGGALLREKLVALASEQEMIIADDSKLVRKLGERQPVPVEVVRFGWQQTSSRLERLGGKPVLRMGSGGQPFVTDEGHYTLDTTFGIIEEPRKLASAIKALPGVVEHGIFIGLAHRVIVSGESGVRVIEPGTG